MSEPMDASAAAAAMHRDLADLQRQVQQLRALQASGRYWVLGTLFTVVAMFAVFSLALYAQLKRNFNDQAVQAAVAEHGADVVPMAQRMLTDTGTDVWPVYRDEVMRTMRTEGPDAAKASLDRLKAVPQQSGQAFQERIAKAFDAAVQKVTPEFTAAYPNVPDEKRQQMLKQFAVEQITAQNQRVASTVGQLYQNDLNRMQTTLERFDTPKVSGPGGGDALERQLLHTMVALLDQQVEEAYPTSGTDKGGPADEPARRSTTMPTTAPAAVH